MIWFFPDWEITCKNTGVEIDSHWLPDVRKSISGKVKDMSDTLMALALLDLWRDTAPLGLYPICLRQ